MKLGELIKKNYMPYAHSTIVDRAVPWIEDGLKPVQRRLMFATYQIDSKRTFKSARIVGDTMGKYHPHGDSSIYGALVNMTDKSEYMLAPYFSGNGNFSKVYYSVGAAAMRYTEASLSKLGQTMFEGLNEGIVEMIDNFDMSEKEPAYLPAKFPTVLVNSTNGIAVGYASYIPTFNLGGVCDATIAMIQNPEISAGEFANKLGLPDFPTGGTIHIDTKSFESLITAGTGGFTLTGNISRVRLKNGVNVIRVTSLPYGVKVEDVVDSIRDMAFSKDGYLKDEVSDVKNISGKNGLGIDIYIKRGADIELARKKILKKTDIRCKVNYVTRVLVGGELKTLSVYDVVKTWVEYYRVPAIHRQYQFKLNKELVNMHKLSTWKLINGHIKEIVNYMSAHNKKDSASMLASTYGLDEIQIKYFMAKNISTITTDEYNKAMEELKESERLVELYKGIATEDDKAKELIIEQLKEVKEKFSSPRKTKIVAAVSSDDEPDVVVEEEEVISDEIVTVGLTKKGYVMKFKSEDLESLRNADVGEDDKMVKAFRVKNNNHLLAITYNGSLYRVPVWKIDEHRNIKTHIWEICNKREEDDDICYVVDSNPNGHINIVFPNGKGVYLRLEKYALGRNERYVNVFENNFGNRIYVTKEDKFFLITSRKKATYIDLGYMQLGGRIFTMGNARDTDGNVIGLLEASKVPNIESIDTDRYSRGYFVLIKDKLW